MKTIKGPAIFLAQFLGDEVPFDNLAHLAGWAAGLGFKGIQVPCDRAPDRSGAGGGEPSLLRRVARDRATMRA